ncbi:ZIP family metal transporter [Bacillus sp. USDA818B3_A]|uniref:ZIP family metal transporter n=1 Tax=Bacillus sp. USDA818B3_A TaxID=2698834 RepID=UPI0013697556|nr:ZIP family metal transporter [Bacillus sp. USDA818B3_A]
MWYAAMWGAISGSAVFLGSLAALFLPIKKRIIGDIMAFGTGILIGAASYELLQDSIHKGGLKATGIGFTLGALVFTILNYLVSKRGADQRKRSNQKKVKAAGLAIFIGTVMDAIPESIMIGASLLEKQQSVSWLLVAAVFLSNIPEGLSSTVGLKNSGYHKGKIFVLWISVLVISSFSAWGGYFFLSNAPEYLLAGIAAFAGGGIIAMVTSTMMPEAYEDSGTATGLIAAMGLLVSLIMDHFSS